MCNVDLLILMKMTKKNVQAMLILMKTILVVHEKGK